MANVNNGTRFELLSLRDVSWVTSGTNDPTLGEAAPQGSVFLRDATTQGELYLKTGPTDTDWTLLATGQDVQAVYQIFTDMKEPTGHVDRSESRILFDNGTRTFTIEPNTPTSTEFNYYIHGVKHTITTPKTAVIPNTQGIHFLYLDENEVVQVQTGVFLPAILYDYAYCAVIYWDVGTQLATYFGEERHGMTMDGVTHAHFHSSLGTQYISGLALNSLNPDIGAPVNTDAWVGVDNGQIRDEDIQLLIEHSVTGADDTTTILEQILAAPAQIPVLYRTGPNGDWRFKTADDYSIIYSGSAGYTDPTNGLPAWNEWTGVTWQLTPVQNNHFVLTHIIATNDMRNPIIALQGVTDYTNKPQGLDAARQELAVMSGLPFQEFTPIATLIWECRNTYTNVVKSRLRTTDDGDDYVDWRTVETFASTIGGGGIADHGNLSGLADDDHLQYVYTQGTVRPIVEINATPNDGDVLTYDLANGWWEAATPVTALDELVKVSVNDTTAGYLNGKLVSGTGISLTENNDGANETLTITNTAPNVDQNIFLNFTDGVNTAVADTTTDTFTFTAGTGISVTITPATDTLTITNTAPNVDQNLWATFNADTGTTTANTTTDTLTVSGGTGISTSITGDTLTITSTVVNTDETVKVSANDTTAGYLNGKLVAGTNITLVENNDGANETLTINATVGGSASRLSRHNGAVTQTFDVTPTTILFGTNIRTDADFSYTAGVTTINTTSWYELTFDVTYDNTSNQQNVSQTWVEVNGTPVAGSYAYGYHRATGTGHQTASASVLLNLTAADTVEIVSVRFAGTTSLVTIADACRLNMTRIS